MTENFNIGNIVYCWVCERNNEAIKKYRVIKKLMFGTAYILQTLDTKEQRREIPERIFVTEKECIEFAIKCHACGITCAKKEIDEAKRIIKKRTKAIKKLTKMLKQHK